MTIDARSLALAVEQRLSAWDREGVGERIWAHDPTVWADPDTPEITNRLGWLRLPATMPDRADRWRGFADEADVDEVVLLGMGGSSLAPEVFAEVIGGAPGRPGLSVLDTTHPDAIAMVTDRLDPERTLFVVSSKSGGTLETLSLFRHFWAWRSATTDAPGTSFVAITDPGSGLGQLAEERGFRAVFTADPEVGGRYSALTDFGLVPAALIGIDPADLLAPAASMASVCGASVPVLENPALWLGAMLGEAALGGRDKCTIVTTPGLAAFPAWLEQLIAESTGKHGRGIVPVADEPLLPPDGYGDDRVFLVYHLDDEPSPAGVDELEAAGHPVIRITVDGVHGLGAEMFRAELATAAAGAVLDINPFDQPDVEAAKQQARSLMSGDAPTPEPPPPLADDALDEVVAAVDPGDYVSIQAYAAPNGALDVRLAGLAATLRSRTGGTAVTIGYGPRFLHSTGQLHKGGGDGCVALQLVGAPTTDLPIPETDLSFGRVIAAQAAGDAAVLGDRGRTVVRRSM
ncbi:MAG: glucose-6-phosphate isomerase [Acidimicrobiia bacterium]